MPPTVSVIIPCRNEEKTINLVLEAIHAQSYPLELMEVIIADGLSVDATRLAIQSFAEAHPKLKISLIDNPKQTIPAALNLAINASSSEIVLRMDAHSLPSPDYVRLCVEALEANKAENVGGVWKIRPQNSSWIARSIAAAAMNPFAVGDAHYRFTDKADYVDTVPYGAYRRELFNKIGAYDESLLANEDYELNTRIRQSGGRIWLDPAIECTYFARPNLAKLAQQYWNYGYWKAQMLKRYPETLRYRQAIPPLFVLGLLFLVVLGFFWRAAWGVLGVVFGLYLIIQWLVALRISLKQSDFWLSFGIVFATLTMHLSWGSAFIYGLFSSPKRK